MDNNENMETANVQKYVKDLLRSRIFLGRYVERRLADQRIGYRDVVLLSPAEVELKKDLLDAQHKLQTIYPIKHWIGISDSETIGYPSGLCLWTEIDNQPFGPFWFQIKSVKFRDVEIIITLKCIRHISNTLLEVQPALTSAFDKYKDKSDGTEKIEAFNEIAVNFKNSLTLRNVGEFVTFLVIFFIVISTVSTALINYLGNFKFLR